MARVNIEEIVNHLSSEMRSALKQSVEKTVPGVDISSYQLFREFRRAVGRKCGTWKQVPNNCVEQ